MRSMNGPIAGWLTTTAEADTSFGTLMVWDDRLLIDDEPSYNLNKRPSEKKQQIRFNKNASMIFHVTYQKKKIHLQFIGLTHKRVCDSSHCNLGPICFVDVNTFNLLVALSFGGWYQNYHDGNLRQFYRVDPSSEMPVRETQQNWKWSKKTEISYNFGQIGLKMCKLALATKTESHLKTENWHLCPLLTSWALTFVEVNLIIQESSFSMIPNFKNWIAPSYEDIRVKMLYIS